MNDEIAAVLRLCSKELRAWMKDHGQDIRSQEAAKRADALLAAGASEGQAEPVYQVKRVHGWVDVPESRYTEIKEDPNDCGELRILYLHPSAEIAALRERIVGMEKDAIDAGRFRTLYKHGVPAVGLPIEAIDLLIGKEKQR